MKEDFRDTMRLVAGTSNTIANNLLSNTNYNFIAVHSHFCPGKCQMFNPPGACGRLKSPCGASFAALPDYPTTCPPQLQPA